MIPMRVSPLAEVAAEAAEVAEVPEVASSPTPAELELQGRRKNEKLLDAD